MQSRRPKKRTAPSASPGEADDLTGLVRELQDVSLSHPGVARFLRMIAGAHLRGRRRLQEMQREMERLNDINGKMAVDLAHLRVPDWNPEPHIDSRKEMEAHALEKAHAAVLIVDPSQGLVVYANEAAERLYGPSVGMNVFALFLNSLSAFAESPGMEDSVVRGLPEPFGKSLWRRVREDGETVQERVLLKTVTSRGPVDTVLVMQTYSDGKDRSWVLIEAQEIERLNKDAMTGLYRREVAIAALTRELAHRERGGNLELDPVSVIMLDIDDFKSCNTRYGYEGGNRVIRRVAGVIGSEIRPKDLACRWFSGDEFLVVLYGNAAVATAVAERVCRKIEGLQVRVTDKTGEGTFTNVTVSVGVAGQMPGDDWKALVVRAEAELGRAKCGGKGRVSSVRHRAANG